MSKAERSQVDQAVATVEGGRVRITRCVAPSSMHLPNITSLSVKGDRGDATLYLSDDELRRVIDAVDDIRKGMK